MAGTDAGWKRATAHGGTHLKMERKPKLNSHQRAEATKRRDGGEAVREIAHSLWGPSRDDFTTGRDNAGERAARNWTTGSTRNSSPLRFWLTPCYRGQQQSASLGPLAGK